MVNTLPMTLFDVLRAGGGLLTQYKKLKKCSNFLGKPLFEAADKQIIQTQMMRETKFSLSVSEEVVCVCFSHKGPAI